ncbi:MAG: hypothetical protein ACTTJH_02550 [Bacteroidales bacterium]
MLEYYVKEQSFNDMQGGSKPRYIARLNEKSVLTTEELCERVSKACTLSKHEMLLAIGQMQDVMLAELAYGRGVQFGKLGVFHPSIESKARADKSSMDVDSIVKVNCNFRVSHYFRRFLNELKFRKVVRPKGF